MPTDALEDPHIDVAVSSDLPHAVLGAFASFPDGDRFLAVLPAAAVVRLPHQSATYRVGP